MRNLFNKQVEVEVEADTPVRVKTPKVKQGELDIGGETSDDDHDSKGSRAVSPSGGKSSNSAKDLLIANLCSFIKYNPSLIHLDLSNTGLDFEILHHLADNALIKTRSMTCLHLSGNPGVNQELIEFIRERLKCREEPD